MLGYLLRNRKVWGLTIGFSAYGYSFYLFLTWLPGYLVQTLHMNIMQSAGYATIPWRFTSLSDLFIGDFLVDHLIAKGHDEGPQVGALPSSALSAPQIRSGPSRGSPSL
jgi:ACS family D-galactonate transporter-like MFS transporter